jgi:hypothetical protein
MTESTTSDPSEHFGCEYEFDTKTHVWIRQAWSELTALRAENTGLSRRWSCLAEQLLEVKPALEDAHAELEQLKAVADYFMCSRCGNPAKLHGRPNLEGRDTAGCPPIPDHLSNPTATKAKLDQLVAAVANAGMLVRSDKGGRLYITMPPMHKGHAPNECDESCQAAAAWREIESYRSPDPVEEGIRRSQRGKE